MNNIYQVKYESIDRQLNNADIVRASTIYEMLKLVHTIHVEEGVTWVSMAEYAGVCSSMYTTYIRTYVYEGYDGMPRSATIRNLTIGALSALKNQMKRKKAHDLSNNTVSRIAELVELLQAA